MASLTLDNQIELVNEFDVLKYRLQYLNGLKIQADGLTFEDSAQQAHYCHHLNAYFEAVKACYRTLDQLMGVFNNKGLRAEKRGLLLAYQQAQKHIKVCQRQFIEMQPLRLNHQLDCQIWGMPSQQQTPSKIPSP